MKNEEQIVRMVKLFGNGAHVFVPKDWTGEEIVLIKPRKKSLKERIISSLDPYLDSIIGVYLYGSYARSEEKKDSDIDLFVIIDKKIKIKAEGFEIICLEQKEIEKAIKLEPLLMYSIFSEAKPIINSALLENLKIRYKPKLSYFKEYLKDCRRIIKVNEEFLESEKGDYLSSDAVIYSLVLRLRGIFMIKSILSEENYTHKMFNSWITGKLSEIDFDLIYEAYRSSKNDKKIKQQIKVSDIRLLIKFLKSEILKLESG